MQEEDPVTDIDTLPYRPCVGVVILNADDRVWIGERMLHPDSAGNAFKWQMPQGGVDPGEDPLAAARREVFEETGITSLEFLAEAPDWYCYDLPAEILASGRWKARFRGQTQKWYAFRFTGEDSEINILEPPDGSDQEFVSWRWEDLLALPELIIPFKRPVYEQVVSAFRHLVEGDDPNQPDRL